MGLPVWIARPARGEEFVFYFPGSHSVLPADVINHVQYLPLLRLINLFGKIDGLQGRKKSLKVWFGNTQIEVHEDSATVRLNNVRFELSDPIRVQNGEWKVPVDFLSTALPTLLNQTVAYQVGGNRVFIGDVQPSTFTVRIAPLLDGARLTLHFSQKIDLRTAARNGKWILFLGGHPVEPIESNLTFQNAYVSDLQFDDRDGIPKLILSPTSSGLDLFPSLTDGGKVLVAEVRKPEGTSATRASQTAGSAKTVPPPAATASAFSAQTPAAPASEAALPAIVLDAGHGGSDAGARGQNGLLEKDLTAQIVARVRLALIATGKYRVVLTRIGDVDPTFDEREAAANIVHPVAFISFHAGDLGASIPQVNVYSYLPSEPLISLPTVKSVLFTPWNSVQEAYLDRSRQLAATLQQQLEATAHDAPDQPISAPVRILRSIAAPSVAVEVGSLAPDTDPTPLTQPNFQQQLAAGVVRAMAQIQGGAP